MKKNRRNFLIKTTSLGLGMSFVSFSKNKIVHSYDQKINTNLTLQSLSDRINEIVEKIPGEKALKLLYDQGDRKWEIAINRVLSQKM